MKEHRSSGHTGERRWCSGRKSNSSPFSVKPASRPRCLVSARWLKAGQPAAAIWMLPADRRHENLPSRYFPAGLWSDGILVSALRRLVITKAATSPPVQRLLETCREHLNARIAEPLEAPKDWRRTNKLKCQCHHCNELSRFLDNPEQKRWAFKAALSAVTSPTQFDDQNPTSMWKPISREGPIASSVSRTRTATIVGCGNANRIWRTLQAWRDNLKVIRQCKPKQAALPIVPLDVTNSFHMPQPSTSHEIDEIRQRLDELVI